MRDLQSAVVYTFGSAAGGILTATALWVASGILAPLPAHLKTALLLLGLGWTLMPSGTVLRLQLPQNSRQIPQEVLLEGGRWGVLQFGFEIGTGVRTYLPTTTAHALAMFLLFANPTLAEAVTLGTGFGMGRALQLIVAALVTDRDSMLEGWHLPVEVLAAFAPVVPVVVTLAVVFHGNRGM